jgi:hypothetical protein
MGVIVSVFSPASREQVDCAPRPRERSFRDRREGAGGLRRPDPVAEINPYGSYLSTSDTRLYLGLGSATTARIEIEWPSGRKQALDSVPANQILLLDEANFVLRAEAGAKP